MKKNMNNSAALTEDERKKMRKAALIKMLAMGIFVVVVMVFGSIAWFTMNQENTASGMGVKVETLPYQIVRLDGIASIYEQYRTSVQFGTQSSIASADSEVWYMTNDSKMDNYDSENDAGIKPGSSGKVSFIVRPNDISVNLDLSFKIVGYHLNQTIDSQTEQITENMTRVNDELQGYLNGHILLFEEKNPIYEVITNPDTGEETTTSNIIGYTYSKPILSTNGLNKVIQNRTFTKPQENETEEVVHIYWVWPKTLSLLVDASEESEHVSAKPFCVGNDYSQIINNIIAYPNRYFFGYVSASNEGENPESVVSTLTELEMARNYDIYGDKYDRADNAIGTNVSYITLEMRTNVHSGNGE